MNDRLSWLQISLLVTYAVAMAGGQILFKLAALRSPASAQFSERLGAMAANKFFAAAIALYAVLTLLWVWILSFTPLSRAYLFVALAFAITPFAGGIVFGEPITARLAVGVAVIVLGLVIVAG
jgi:drug/metabolite transporter (DMT)-like permease